MLGNVKSKFNDIISKFRTNDAEEAYVDYGEYDEAEYLEGDYSEENYQEDDLGDMDYDVEERQETSGFFRPQTQRTTRNSSAVKMQIVKPVAFEEARDIILMLKNNQSVVLNLEYMSKENARRIVDSISGGLIALDGGIFKITNSIFIAAPKGYQINDVKKSGVNAPGFSFMGN